MNNHWIKNGTKSVQLYICPSCGYKEDSTILTYHCDVCGKQLCYYCKNEIAFEGHYSYRYYCSKDYRKMLHAMSMLPKFIRRLGKN